VDLEVDLALPAPELARRAVLAERRDELDGAELLRVPKPDGSTEPAPRPASRAAPATTRLAVNTPATPYTALLRATSRTRGENNAAVAAAAIATSDSMKSSAAIGLS
jgi:hypothetical protein